MNGKLMCTQKYAMYINKHSFRDGFIWQHYCIAKTVKTLLILFCYFMMHISKVGTVLIHSVLCREFIMRKMIPKPTFNSKGK